jgi:hypothetical protein
MSLTDTTYFKDDISLPNGENSNLADILDKYEKELLIKLFGYELAKEILEYNESSSPQRIKDIVEGKEYTVSCSGRNQLIKWNGLINDEKVSLLAYYNYYWWHRNKVTQSANVGEVIPQQQHSDVASPALTASGAWHRMRELYGFCGQDELEPSAFNFMTEFSDDYPEWIFKEIGIITYNGL